MKKKVLLINLREKKTHPSHPLPPFDLLYLAKHLEENKIETRIIDVILNKRLEKILAKLSFDIFIIKPQLDNVQAAIRLSKKIKGSSRKRIVILVGPAIKFFTKKLRKIKQIDLLAFGEYEFYLTKKLKEYPKKRKIIECSIKKNISNIGGVKPKKVIGTKYLMFYPSIGIFRKRVGFIMYSRGCPFSCSFCSELHRSSLGKVVRSRSVNDVISEFKNLEKKGINLVYFLDDNILAAPKVRQLLKSLCREKIKIKFIIQARPDLINKEIVDLLKKAGCSTVCLGVESFSEFIKDAKRISKKHIISAVKLLKSANLKLVLFLMVGVPNEKFEDIKEMLEFCKRTSPDMIQISFFTLIPGSSIFKKYRRVKIHATQLVYDKPANPFFSESYLKRVRRYFYLRYYTYPSSILKILKQLPDFIINIDIYSKLFISTLKFFMINLLL